MKKACSIAAILLLVPAADTSLAAPNHRASAPRAYLGVALAPLTALDRRQKKVPRYGGVLIQSVLKGTPAFRVGLQPGDVIMKLGASHVYKPADVLRGVAAARVGSRLTVTIIRNGAWMRARVLLTTRPRKAIAPRARPLAAGRASARPHPSSNRTVLRRLEALRREVQTLKRMIRGLKMCRRH